MQHIPYVEKYRPTTLEKIVLSESNDKIFHTMLEKRLFPNMLLYGPPGTGKTTTIINFVNCVQPHNKSLVLHLNASDERGIDTIRSQIAKFVSSKALFVKGIKFIILDEVDYMTKSAQLALKYLMQKYQTSVVFCLICNYISKIEDVLKSEFIELKFNSLPKNKILEFLTDVVEKEKLKIDSRGIEGIQSIFSNDIRSMLNYLQLHYANKSGMIHSSYIMNNDDIQRIYIELNNKCGEKRKSYFLAEALKYNTTYKLLSLKIFNMLVRERKITDLSAIRKFESIIHEDQFNIYEIDYLLHILCKLCLNDNTSI